MNNNLIGRATEVKQLQALLQRPLASLVVLQGRRRIGKSRLAQEFASSHRFIQLVGMAEDPTITDQMQRDEFARQLAEQTQSAQLKGDDWGNLFTGLAHAAAQGRVVILFDEISWMGSKDPTFLPKLKTAWDTQLSKNPKLMLILCGSVSSWIQHNILSSTAFLGRVTLYLRLRELSLAACNQFFAKQPRLSAYEKLKILAITGGVPRYLELIQPQQSAETNIQRLCFDPTGPLVHEFGFIFNDIFGKRSNRYQQLLKHLINRPMSLTDLVQAENKTKTGDYSAYLSDLELAGFIAKEPSINLKSGSLGRASYYRIQDNYLRFYLRYLEPRLPRILANQLHNASLSALPGWYAWLGLQFENLVLNNRNHLLELLRIPLEDVLAAAPYVQKPTQRKKGCQIDLLILTRHKTLYLCEIKFSQHPIDTDVIEAVEDKCRKLARSKHTSLRAVLIHVNGVTDAVLDQQYFAKIIDFSELLTRT